MADKSIDRGIVKYTSRDYDSVLEDFWAAVPMLTDLWKPEADADPGVVLGKFLASVADMLGINLDILANELFGPSVQQRKNAEKLFGLIGYDLGWYTAARTEVTFTNSGTNAITFDFGFNGSNFTTLNAYTDITSQDRIITYNVLPLTGKFGGKETRSKREILTTTLNVFADHDKVRLEPGESVTRIAIEGELRSVIVSVSEIKANNYKVTLPSQHVDTTAVWVKAKSSLSSEDYLDTQWIQCANISDFIVPEPRFAVVYDNYSNAQIQVSNYLNQLEDYENNYLQIYWIDCSGVIGCVGENTLSNLLYAQVYSDATINPSPEDVSISNLSNTIELPHSATVTGKSPETAKQAYKNSRNYINTWDSLITLPDYTRFLNREPGVDCGVVIDCQKALEINLAIYNDENLTDEQKQKMYITKYDFPEGEPIFDWKSILDLDFDPSDPNKFVFSTNFKRYTGMCFAIHNDFLDSSYGSGITNRSQINNKTNFTQYKPPQQFIDNVINDYKPLQSMSVDIEFGYARIFTFYVVGQIFTVRPVTVDVANILIEKVKETLRLHFSPAGRAFGQKPTVMEIVNLIQNCDENIQYFDAGSPTNNIITWKDCDPEYFNYISFARFKDIGGTANNLRVAPECLIK